MRQKAGASEFHVSTTTDIFSASLEKFPRLWRRLGDIESEFLEEKIQKVSIESPIYISGLARSGTTILLELLADVPGVATHKYRDFPPVYTPYWWNWMLERVPRNNQQPQERAHKDRIAVTSESAEAMEEVLWMAFFTRAHSIDESDVLDSELDHEEFARFYRNHIRKLLLIRKGKRYLSKGNYNITRLGYIRKLFPDARFVLPIRNPVGHIASLIKQHELFLRNEEDNPRATSHLRRVGHFEFGAGLRPINTGDRKAAQNVVELWNSGQSVKGWARYWSQVYGFVLRMLETDEELAKSVLIVRYEDLCEFPEEIIRSLIGHCRLDVPEPLVSRYCSKISQPNYYSIGFTDHEMEIIDRETSITASAFGYDNMQK
jgi:hypothetical protein